MKPFLLKCRANQLLCLSPCKMDGTNHAHCWRHCLIVGSLSCVYYRLDPPPFMTTQRSGFNNLHNVTDVTTVLFIVSQNLFRFPDDLFVKRMLKSPNNRHCDSFIHTVTRNKTCPKFAMSSSFLAQLYPPNQSKLMKVSYFSTQYKFDETEWE